MAEKKLTQQAINFIIESREDITKVNTFEKIAKQLNEQFGIKVTKQTVWHSYMANKDDGVIPAKSKNAVTQPLIEQNAPIENVSLNSTATIDPSVGESKTHPQLLNFHEKKAETEKRKSLFETSFKRNEVLDDETKLLFGI